MATLRIFALAAALLSATPAQGESVADWRGHIVAASRRFGIPVAWIERVMQAESAGRTTRNGRPIVSRAGAMGLMQLMPATWAELRAVHALGPDPHDPRDNIFAGVAYLRAMYDRFGYPGLFAAYNAGPARYADYLAGRRGLPGETRAYLASVSGQVGRTPSGRAVKSSSLFAVQHDRTGIAPAALAPTPSADPTGLFAIARPR